MKKIFLIFIAIMSFSHAEYLTCANNEYLDIQVGIPYKMYTNATNCNIQGLKPASNFPKGGFVKLSSKEGILQTITLGTSVNCYPIYDPFTTGTQRDDIYKCKVCSVPDIPFPDMEDDYNYSAPFSSSQADYMQKLQECSDINGTTENAKFTCKDYQRCKSPKPDECQTPNTDFPLIPPQKISFSTWVGFNADNEENCKTFIAGDVQKAFIDCNDTYRCVAVICDINASDVNGTCVPNSPCDENHTFDITGACSLDNNKSDCFVGMDLDSDCDGIPNKDDDTPFGDDFDNGGDDSNCTYSPSHNNYKLQQTNITEESCDKLVVDHGISGDYVSLGGCTACYFNLPSDCPPNSTFNIFGECSCNSGYTKYADGLSFECVEGNNTCGANSHKNLLGDCVCNTGFHLTDSTCIENNSTCKANESLDLFGNCVCVFGYIQNSNGDCILKNSDTNCTLHSTPNIFGSCICDAGYVKQNDVCIVNPCEANQHLDLFGNCDCDSNSTRSYDNSGNLICLSSGCTSDDPHIIVENGICKCREPLVPLNLNYSREPNCVCPPFKKGKIVNGLLVCVDDNSTNSGVDNNNTNPHPDNNNTPSDNNNSMLNLDGLLDTLNSNHEDLMDKLDELKDTNGTPDIDFTDGMASFESAATAIGDEYEQSINSFKSNFFPYMETFFCKLKSFHVTFTHSLTLFKNSFDKF